MQDNYSEKAMEHFLNPKHMGEMDRPDGVGEVGNPKCGDIMKVFIKVEEGKITDMSFKTLGCAAAIATSDMICEVATGKSIEDALEVTFQDLVDELGSLPQTKVHCADLAQKGLKEAVEDYEGKGE